MTGVEIVGTLLAAEPALTALVPASRMRAALMPDAIPLPALVIRSISATERKDLMRVDKVQLTERVSVTVRAVDYRQQAEVMRHVRNACAHWTGNMDGAENIAITEAGRGPDVIGPNNSFEQAQDFMVRFVEETA